VTQLWSRPSTRMAKVATIWPPLNNGQLRAGRLLDVDGPLAGRELGDDQLIGSVRRLSCQRHGAATGAASTASGTAALPSVAGWTAAGSGTGVAPRSSGQALAMASAPTVWWKRAPSLLRAAIP